MKLWLLLLGMGLLSACASNKPFMPKSDYPPDPWVKGYTDPDDCLGGEQLAARRFELPAYPGRAFRSGRQGWVLLRLDVDAQGETQNVTVERAVPDRLFGGSARKAAEDWQFEPPKDGSMQNCRVLLRYRLGAVSLGG
ncbi:MAG: energy transducer TonB [Acidimicrobiales bacterium]|nr:energy transducer TonB [Hyphomonadaceae bacterium]RZV45029.1 MAG: energy transducer TonB [Acidimicrobiales bacterium]